MKSGSAGPSTTRRLPVAAVFAAALVSLQPAAAVGQSAPRSAITQLEGVAGCTVDATASPVDECLNIGRALQGATALAISPDGENVYVAAKTSNAVTAFSRNPITGELTQLEGEDGCVSETGADGCADGRALLGASSVAVSPDGANVYVTTDAPPTGSPPRESDDGVAILRRADDGSLTQDDGPSGCFKEQGDGVSCADGRALQGASGVTVSPAVSSEDDGASVYVTSQVSGGVAVFERDGDTGILGQPADSTGCVLEVGGGTTNCADGKGLLKATSAAVSPDGDNLYVVSNISQTVGAVAVFARGWDPTTGQDLASASEIRQFSGAPGTAAAGCWKEPPTTECTKSGDILQTPSLAAAQSIALSPDGTTVHIALARDGRTQGGVSTFGRSAVDGTLAVLTGGKGTPGCIAVPGSGLSCEYRGRALGGARAIAISPDGEGAYVAASWSDAVSALRRFPDALIDAGHLEQPETDARYCFVDAAADDPLGPVGNCENSGRGVKGAAGVAVSPDEVGLHVYVAAAQSGSVATFTRSLQLEPVCAADVPLRVARNTPVTVKLNCADPEGQPLTYKILVQPAHGTLGEIDQAAGTVTYTPVPDFPRGGSEGQDSFWYEVTDGINQPVEWGQTLTILPDSAQAGEAARGAGAGGPTSVRIFGRALRLSRSGKVNVGLRCRSAASSRCIGTLTLKTDSRLNRRSGKRVPRLTLGRARYSIPADRTRRINVALTKAGRGLLGRQPRARAWVWLQATAVTGSDSSGTTTRDSILLKANRAS